MFRASGVFSSCCSVRTLITRRQREWVNVSGNGSSSHSIHSAAFDCPVLYFESPRDTKTLNLRERCNSQWRRFSTTTTAAPVETTAPTTISAANTTTTTSKKPAPQKPWMEVNRPIKSRSKDLIASRTIHPADFASKEMNELIKHCCLLGTLEGMELAQDVVDRLLVEKRRLQSDTPSVCVSVDLLQTLLFGWAMLAQKLRVAQPRMRDVLQLAIDEAKQDIAKNPGRSVDNALQSQPTVQIFNTYLTGLKNAAKLMPQAALNAEALLYEMSELNRTLGWHTKPNTRSFTLVINAFANTRHLSSGQRALGILRRMQKVHAAEKESYENFYGVPYDVRNPAANKRRIVTPDATVFTCTMKALITSKQSETKTFQLLNEAVQEDTVVLDEYIFTTAIRSISDQVEKERDARKRIEAAEQAEKVLTMMEEYSNSRGFESGEDGEEAKRSQAVLAGYNACLDVWSRTYCKEAAPYCESILQRIIEEKDFMPNTTSFNTCLYAWNRAHKFHDNAAARSEELLKLQLELSKSTEMGGENVRPDFQTYNLVILTYAESKDPEKLLHSKRILETMLDLVTTRELPVKRNPSSPFSAVLTAAARTPPQSTVSKKDDVVDGFTSAVDTETDPYSIANRIYQLLQSDTYGIGTKVDHHAASAFLRVIAQHCAPGSSERESATRRVFEEACEAGEVSRLVISALETVLESGADFPELNPNKRPKFWSRNVPAAFR